MYYHVKTAAIGDDSHIRYRKHVEKILQETSNNYDHEYIQQPYKGGFICGLSGIHVFTFYTKELESTIQKLTNSYNYIFVEHKNKEDLDKYIESVWKH